MRKYVVEPFTNYKGQVINPGDPVYYIGRSWGTGTLRKGVFEGVYYDDCYTWKDGKYVSGYNVDSIKIGQVEDTKYNYSTKEMVKISRKAIIHLKRIYKADATSIEDLIGECF